MLFVQVNRHVNDLFEDLRDGLNLISLLEVLSGEHLVSISIIFISSTNNFRHLTHAKRSVRPLTKKPWDADISGPILGKNLGEAYVSGRLPAEMIISLTAV